MILLGLAEWLVIVTACHLGMSFNPGTVYYWLTRKGNL